jgi:hypothetical protein
MIGPFEPYAAPRPPAPTVERCLLVGDGSAAGPRLLTALREGRLAAEQRGARFEVQVLVPYGQPLVACLALGDPLSGWVVTDEAASRAWQDASRDAAYRRLVELLWLLWEMNVPARGTVVDRTALADRLHATRAGYDGVIIVRSATFLARWRQRSWTRRLHRLAAPVAFVDDRG